MGLFCVNFHFRTTDEAALSAALERQGVARYHALPAKRGWTSLYEERASQQDDERIRDLAAALTKELCVPAIAFLVHDSDIARYWLFDNGRLLDEFNSCPDYFGDDPTGDGRSGPAGGKIDILLRYCRSGVREDELTAILAEQAVFAESVIEQLADALGIDGERALADYRDVADGEGPGGFGGADDGDGDDDNGDDDDGGDDPGGGSKLAALQTRMAGQWAKLFGAASASADPQATKLVEAAVRDDVEAIDRLLDDGVAVDAEGPAALIGGKPLAGLVQLLPGGAPKVAMTPLLAAVVNKRRGAAERLLDAGADANRAHPIFGTALHVASGAGDVELLQLLIDRGGNVNARNAQGQTPLELIAAGRAAQERLAQAQAMIKSMGGKLPSVVGSWPEIELPLAGWDACERLLKSHAAK
jgi:hypothetical protein